MAEETKKTKKTRAPRIPKNVKTAVVSLGKELNLDVAPRKDGDEWVLVVTLIPGRVCPFDRWMSLRIEVA